MVQQIKDNIKENWKDIRFAIELVMTGIFIFLAFWFNSTSSEFKESAKKLDTILYNMQENKLNIQVHLEKINKIESVNEKQDEKIQGNTDRIIKIESKVFKDRNNNFSVGE